MNDSSLSAMRQNYTKDELLEDQVLPDPIDQFACWFSEVLKSGTLEANAMIVSTVAADGMPSARTVLLKGFDERGFVFYTNYESQKGKELTLNPAVALTFYWPSLERQVRINGTASRVDAVESDSYFASRPLGSQLGSAASPQSEVIPGREMLVSRVAALAGTLQDNEALPRPSFWGGYRVAPSMIEFWQGRPDRVHDRLRYRLSDGRWVIERLAP